MHRVDPVMGQIGCYNTQFVPPLDPLGQCDNVAVQMCWKMLYVSDRLLPYQWLCCARTVNDIVNYDGKRFGTCFIVLMFNDTYF